MACGARKCARVTKFLFAGVTVFCVSWIACVGEWHGGGRWRGRRGAVERAPATMRTIVAYSEGKLAEMERPAPVACDRLPALPTVPHIDRTWWPGQHQQGGWQRVAGTQVTLYAAYYDERSAQPYIRILASFKGRSFSMEETLFCQTRPINPNEDSVEVVEAKPLEIWFEKWDSMSTEVETPLLLSCPLKEPLYTTSLVSVVTEPCDDPTNGFSLEPSKQNPKYNRKLTICVKDMNFDTDISQNLIEWISINRILGVDLIDMYVDKVSKETEKVLSYYRSKGYIRLFHVPIKYKLERLLWQRRRDHIITYNDCLYRNIEESEYIVPLDVDEIVLPKVAKTLPELLTRLADQGWDPNRHSAAIVQNVFFFDFMQGVQKYKSKSDIINKSKIYIKRDDVRIQESEKFNVTIELIDNVSSLSNEVIDISEIEKVYSNEYKSRCGGDIPVPKLARHVISSALVSPAGHYSKSLMVTKRVLTAFNHYPLASIGVASAPPTQAFWPAPFAEVQLNHYKESCNTTMVPECARYGLRARLDRTARRLLPRLRSELARAAPCPGIMDAINDYT